MANNEAKETCMLYFSRSKEAGKLLPGFPDTITILSGEAERNGLSKEDLDLIFSVIKLNIASNPRSDLIKCLIPEQKIDEQLVEKVIYWFHSKQTSIQVKPATLLTQWLIGLLEFKLVDEKVLNAYYHGFFYMMVKREKFERFVAKLVYMLTKPYDVTRRQVIRLLNLTAKYTRPQKHLIALLSLFKSYRSENVPELIPAANIESAWLPMPEWLRASFGAAAERCTAETGPTKVEDGLVWNSLQNYGKFAKKRPLLPVTAYVKLGASIFQKESRKSIFEITSLEDLGKYQFSVELPCNALSLLVNTAGQHILTFAETDYRNRFWFNLYNTLQRAFILELGTWPYVEREKLLTKVVEFLRYSQQSNLLLSRFLMEYMTRWNLRHHRENILALLEWINFATFVELHDAVLVPLRTLYECSSVDIKCLVIETLRHMACNLFRENSSKQIESPVRSATQMEPEDFVSQITALVTFVRHLIIIGLQATSYDTVLLSESLLFYEQISVMEERSKLSLWSVAPPAVIYGGFLSGGMNIFSRVCGLLLRYRATNRRMRALKLRDLFGKEIRILDAYAKDIASVLLLDKAFSSRDQGYFLKTISDTVVKDLTFMCNLDQALNITHHYATLPYKFILIDKDVNTFTKDGALRAAELYYPAVHEFLKTSTKPTPSTSR